MDDTAVGEQFEEAVPSMSLSAYQTTHPVRGDAGTLRGELGSALADLPTRQRHVLSLRYLAGLDDIEVSEALGISVRAVRKCASQGVLALRARGAFPEGHLLLG
jgi:RNA polymerase sigma factor (sigma-70 family)